MKALSAIYLQVTMSPLEDWLLNDAAEQSLEGPSAKELAAVNRSESQAVPQSWAMHVQWRLKIPLPLEASCNESTPGGRWKVWTPQSAASASPCMAHFPSLWAAEHFVYVGRAALWSISSLDGKVRNRNGAYCLHRVRPLWRC